VVLGKVVPCATDLQEQRQRIPFMESPALPMLKATKTIQALSIAILITFFQPIVFADGGRAGIDFNRVPSADFQWFIDNDGVPLNFRSGARNPLPQNLAGDAVEESGPTGNRSF